MTVKTPDRPARAQEEILITLRALAGLVAEALRRAGASGNAAAFAQESARLAFWRDCQVFHTRRLLPAVVGDVNEAACCAFAAHLVRAIYLDERGVNRDHAGVSDNVPRHPAADPATTDPIDPLERRR